MRESSHHAALASEDEFDLLYTILGGGSTGSAIACLPTHTRSSPTGALAAGLRRNATGFDMPTEANRLSSRLAERA